MMATPLRKSKPITPASSSSQKKKTPASSFPACKLARRCRRLAKIASPFLDFLRREPYRDEEPAIPSPVAKLVVDRKCRRLYKMVNKTEDLRARVLVYRSAELASPPPTKDDKKPICPSPADTLAWRLLAKKAKKQVSHMLKILLKEKIQEKEGSPPINRQLFKDEEENHGTSEAYAEQGSPTINRQLFKDDEENFGTAEGYEGEGSRSVGAAEANKEDLHYGKLSKDEEENQGAAEANKEADLQSRGLSNVEEENQDTLLEQRIHQELQSVINKDLLFKELVKSPQTIVKDIRTYIKSYRQTSGFEISTCNDKILQVVYKNSEQVLSEIGKLKAFARSNDNTFPVPSRADANQKYNFELDRHVLEKEDAQRKRKNEHKFEVLDALLTIIYELCMREITTEIRTVYYRNPELFKSRDKVSAAIDDLCCMIGCTRSSLHVYASEKGIVFGNISFSVGNQRYNCTTGGIKGTPIPSKTDKIKSMKNKDALFILVVEKETVFQRLVEDGFCRKYRCILITAKGMPDVASRFFLRKMWSEFQLPVFALVDFDPYGLKILSVFRNGSKNMSFDSENLTTPDIKLIGMLHKDIERYQIREDLKLKMTDFDIKTAKSLLKKPYISEEEKEGLRYMLDNGIKCEVEAWYSHGIEFLSKVVLPLKIQSMVVPGQPSA